MKIDKEYPATHSMSTAWYAVDVDGNVAILDFGEEGPQPDGIGGPYEYGMDDMVIDDLVEYCESDVKVLPYTKEQVEELLYMEMTPPCDIHNFDCDIILKIVDNKVDEFIKRIQNFENYRIVRLSSELSLFCVSADNFEAFDKEMEMMISEGIILGGYKYDYYIEDKQWQHLPYFVFGQSDWTGDPMERVSIPQHPVRYNQLPEAIKRIILKLPVSFYETEKMQIAEYSQYKLHSNFSTVYQNRYYEKMPLANGEMKYICASVFPSEVSRKCCFCGQCENSNYLQNFYNRQCCDYPTTLIIELFNMHEKSLEYDYNLATKIFYRNSYVINLIHGYPGVDYCKLAPYDENVVMERFTHCHHYLETAVETIIPRVILLQDRSLDYLQKLYTIDIGNHVIEICNMKIPVYLLSELSNYEDTINNLSLQPYLGKVLTQDEKIVSVDEIEGNDNIK